MLILSGKIPFPDLDLEVYRDDTHKHVFYPVPYTPRIRKDENNRPVFLLTKYAFSDADRENNADLPMGGGFVNMDIEFGLTAEQRAEVAVRLQDMIEEEWAKRKDLDRNNENFQYTGPDAELATPQWVDGAVKFHVVDDANLIKGKISDGKPSMLGNNSAIFNATLTPAGATYFQRTLVDEDGSGIDLTPVQVEYELSFMRRIPPATIRIFGSTVDIYHAVSELSHDYDDNWYSADDFTTTESYSERLVHSEVVRIDFDRSEFTQEEVEELQAFAMGQLTAWMQNNLFDKLTQHDASYPDMEDIYSKEADVYRLKTIDQVSVSVLDLRINQTALVPFTIHPQATLETFFSDLSEEEIAEHVREVDLQDTFFTTLDLSVKAFADYEEIAFVKVDIEYPGDSGLKTESFTFESNDSSAGYWDPRLNSDGNREYRYRYAVGFKANPDKTYVTEWIDESNKQLNINVGRPGEINVDILAGQIDWNNLIEQVQVTLSYEDRNNDIDKEEATFVITPEAPSANYRRWIYEDRNKPLRYKASYFLKNGQQVDAQEESLEGNQIVLNDSFVDVLDVIIVPAGNFSSISQILVELRYSDNSGYSVFKPYSISSSDFFTTWRVPLTDPNQRDWEWKQTTIYKDGTKETSSWKEETGSQSLVVSWASPPSIDVSINPVLLKFDRAPVVEVAMTYKGEVLEGESPAVFFFEDKTKQTWSLRVEDDEIKEYDWEATYYVEPEPVVLKGTSSKNRFLIPRTPKPTE